MSIDNQSLRQGHFAKKQIFCKDWLISWSHRSRFELGLQLAKEFAGQRVLDYGCGDGTFLAMLMDQTAAPARATGAERLPRNVKDCHDRLSRENLSFLLQGELCDPQYAGAYDAIVCMEVLEHVVDVQSLLDLFVHLLAPGGKLLLSVPVETGIPLLIKQAARQIAGWRGIGDYPGTSPYTLREYWAGVLTSPRRSIQRPIHRDSNNFAFHDHKGFNWMAFRERLAKRFAIERTLGSPITWLTPHLASQVWFVAAQRPEAST